jgi:NADPH:quinone reductase-like Zn-dependent oxidoreductase
MHAAIYDRFGEPEELRWTEVAEPKTGPETVVVRVRAASVNPVDWQTMSGALSGRFDTLFPVVAGWDVTGIVTAVGPGVRGFRPGDAVMGYIRQDVIHTGSFAEFVGVPERLLVVKPPELSWEQAACLPLAGTTAWQGLFECLRLEPVETVYIQAATGGVGALAAQFALAAGARVIGSCSQGNADWLRGRGADAVDYHHDLSRQVRAVAGDGVDAVFDMYGGELLGEEVGLLRGAAADGDGARRVVSLVDDGVREARGQYLFARPDRDSLEALVRAVVRAGIASRVAQVFPLRDAAEALAVSKHGHPAGKLVLVPED